ncbi:TonB-dependent receptor [Sphingomonas canadensis]|uniref:TonB-dependent receptor n=1 Tax=Sphingomonas canadensis TaxID=1219257 RepID=A0ABW3H5P7_9SPHN|nr:TonB-dependent receptor [Sphingomonas canadensis]MCW3836516.1 TonB-dependent receptor [Sphingomonas canadensis]
MITRLSNPSNARRAAMLGAVLLAGTAWPALARAAADPAPDAQPEAAAPAPQQDAQSAEGNGEEIVVTGYRRSLQNSTNSKKDATGFTDEIFAEDIGKFPDTNLAESFNRVPGVTISREITGEGLNVTIRGLGTNFTRVLLNNAPVAIASTGRTDAQSTNREVDLDLFPTELFSRLTVQKSPTAGMLEGGAAGTVNMRSARPFDNPGTHVTYSGQVTKNSNADDWGYRGSVLASTTSGDFGVLVGVAGVRNRVRVTGYETIGWTNPNLSATQSSSSTRNGTGGGNWTIPGTVPANANIPGVATGTTIDEAFLLARNPGANITQIDNGIIPRLGRPSDEFGTKDRINAIASLEYNGDGFHAYVDGMYGWKKNNLQRIDMNWVGRNGAMIPVNTTYDRSDCTQGCVVTGGTYYNAQWFLEYRPFIEEVSFWGINPGLEVEFSDTLKASISGNYTRSKFHRESPTVLVITPASSGVTVTYDNSAGDFPNVTTNIDLNNPASFGWNGGRVNIQDERRLTETKGIRGDLTWGDSGFNLHVGAAYDDVSREIRGFDNSQAWQNAVCGNRPSVFVPSPNTQPACQGLNSPGAAPAGYPSYPAYGTGYSAGSAGPVTYAGSLIPQSALASYLMPGPSGFVTVDWEKFKAASNYDAFHDAAPEAGGTNTGASGGYVREKVWGAFAELNGDTQLGDGQLKYNIGLRYVRTDQTIGGRVSISDPRNSQDPDGAGPLPAACPGAGNVRDGSCYPNVVNFVYTNTDYGNWLPSASAAYNITGNAVVRAAVSRTMTRPNPSSMLPGLNFSSPSADVGSVGNPALDPFISDNIDLGFEYYTGAEGYVGFAAFRKAVTGFTVNGTVTVPFSALATYGVTYDTLSPTQQAAINSRGGPGSATVVLQQQVNATGTLKVNGLEFNWVQPLDFLLGRYLGINGFGFTANLTLIEQKASGAAPAVATGVSPVTYNLTAYYENHGISARLSTTFAQGNPASGSNQNGIPLASIYNDDYQQWDFGSSFDLAEILGTKGLPELTVDVINITKANQRSYFQFENAAFTSYNPGRQIMIGLRGRF